MSRCSRQYEPSTSQAQPSCWMNWEQLRLGGTDALPTNVGDSSSYVATTAPTNWGVPITGLCARHLAWVDHLKPLACLPLATKARIFNHKSPSTEQITPSQPVHASRTHASTLR